MKISRFFGLSASPSFSQHFLAIPTLQATRSRCSSTERVSLLANLSIRRAASASLPRTAHSWATKKDLPADRPKLDDKKLSNFSCTAPFRAISPASLHINLLKHFSLAVRMRALLISKIVPSSSSENALNPLSATDSRAPQLSLSAQASISRTVTSHDLRTQSWLAISPRAS